MAVVEDTVEVVTVAVAVAVALGSAASFACSRYGHDVLVAAAVRTVVADLVSDLVADPVAVVVAAVVVVVAVSADSFACILILGQEYPVSSSCPFLSCIM